MLVFYYFPNHQNENTQLCLEIFLKNNSKSRILHLKQTSDLTRLCSLIEQAKAKVVTSQWKFEPLVLLNSKYFQWKFLYAITKFWRFPMLSLKIHKDHIACSPVLIWIFFGKKVLLYHQTFSKLNNYHSIIRAMLANLWRSFSFQCQLHEEIRTLMFPPYVQIKAGIHLKSKAIIIKRNKTTVESYLTFWRLFISASTMWINILTN